MVLLFIRPVWGILFYLYFPSIKSINFLSIGIIIGKPISEEVGTHFYFFYFIFIYSLIRFIFFISPLLNFYCNLRNFTKIYFLVPQDTRLPKTLSGASLKSSKSGNSAKSANSYNSGSGKELELATSNPSTSSLTTTTSHKKVVIELA